MTEPVTAARAKRNIQVYEAGIKLYEVTGQPHFVNSCRCSATCGSLIHGMRNNTFHIRQTVTDTVVVNLW